MRWIKGVFLGFLAALAWWFVGATVIFLVLFDRPPPLLALAMLVSTLALWGYVAAHVIRSDQRRNA